MRLYEDGLIGLDDLMVKYIPEGNNNGKEKITLRNLLLHNSGYAPDYPWSGRPDEYNITVDDFYTWVYTTSLSYPTGTSYVYSDISMVILRLVIERVTKTTLDKYVQEKVFNPLGKVFRSFLFPFSSSS